MAVTRTQVITGNTGSGGTALTGTFAAPSANHACLVAIVCTRGNPTITPNSLHGWKQVNVQTSTNLTIAIYYWNDAPPLTAITFTLGTSVKATIHLIEYAGVLKYDSPVGQIEDGDTVATGSSATAGASSSGNTTEADDVMVTGHNSVGTGTYSSPTNGFSLVNNAQSTGGSAGTRNSSEFCEKIATATGSFYSQATLSGSAEWVSAHITLKPAPTGTIAKQVKYFKYTGDGSSNRVFTGLGFQADIIFLFSNAGTEGEIIYWHNGMINTAGSPMQWRGFTDVGGSSKILSVGTDGFTTNGTSMNTLNKKYYGVAFKCEHNYATIDYGTIIGSGADDRNITTPFQPDYVIVKIANATGQSYSRTSAHTGDSSQAFEATNNITNYIQAFGATSFQVGTGLNGVPNAYHYIAFKVDTATTEGGMRVGTYVGTAVDDRDITVATGFRPDLIFNMNGTNGYAGIWRHDLEPDDESGYFATVAPNSDIIQRTFADGFQVGTGQQELLSNYFYACWIGSEWVLEQAATVVVDPIQGFGVVPYSR